MARSQLVGTLANCKVHHVPFHFDPEKVKDHFVKQQICFNKEFLGFSSMLDKNIFYLDSEDDQQVKSCIGATIVGQSIESSFLVAIAFDRAQSVKIDYLLSIRNALKIIQQFDVVKKYDTSQQVMELPFLQHFHYTNPSCVLFDRHRLDCIFQGSPYI